MNNKAKSTEELESAASFTAIPSYDGYGLGTTPGQRGAEILAGFRAEKSPSVETKALSRLIGRIVARLMLGMLRDSAPLNFTLARTMIINGLMRRSLPDKAEGAIIVEIASGMAARGLTLAREMPQAQVIEIDLPSVVAEKQRRLRRARGIDIPPNLSWLSADLGVTPLTEVLDDINPNVIVAEGLLPYLEHEKIMLLAQWVGEVLVDGGAFITDNGTRAGVNKIQELASFFSRQAGSWIGTFDDVEHGRALIQTVGFETVNIYEPSDLIEEMGLPEPLIDVNCFIHAIKGQVSPATDSVSTTEDTASQDSSASDD